MKSGGRWKCKTRIWRTKDQRLCRHRTQSLEAISWFRRRWRYTTEIFSTGKWPTREQGWNAQDWFGRYLQSKLCTQSLHCVECSWSQISRIPAGRSGPPTSSILLKVRVIRALVWAAASNLSFRPRRRQRRPRRRLWWCLWWLQRLTIRPRCDRVVSLVTDLTPLSCSPQLYKHAPR